MKPLIINFLLMLCLLPLQAIAQKAASLQIRILTFERVNGIKDMQMLYAKKKFTKVKMHKNNFSGPFKVQGRSLQFFKSEVDLLADTDYEPKPESSLTVPLSLGSKVLLIAIPVSGKYKFLPVEDSHDQFGKGQIRMINLTGSLIGAKLNSKSASIKPKQVHLWKNISDKKEAHDYPAEFFVRDGEKFNIFSSGYWQYRPELRKYSFIYRDPNSRNIKIKSIADYPAIQKVAKPNLPAPVANP